MAGVATMALSMKKISTTTYQQRTTSIDDVPIDVLLSNILVTLPPKCVGRSRSVCKQWLSLLSTNKFTSANCKHISTTTNQNIILIGTSKSTVYTITSGQQDYLSNKTVLIPFKAHPHDVIILTTINGLLCLSLRTTGTLVIWNPLTRAYRKLPTTTNRGVFESKSDAVGLYLCSPHEYMLLHVKRSHGNITFYKYSQRQDCWKKILLLHERHQDPKEHQWSSGTFNKGVLYFIVSGPQLDLMGFDVASEKIMEIALPDIPTDDADGNLLIIHNDLHMFLTHGFPFWSVDLWRMTCHTWEKVWTFPPIRPILLGCTITYLLTTGRFLVMSRYGDANEIDTTKDGDECYYSLVAYRGLQGAVFTETLASP